eukprot:Blabericola_migrator_1__7883@NODE_402_length_8862_cov_53_826265_g319_i0_p12_GENE_NODE_402_length_8862_cov_53_826265_g319_i0NODE_402_length_8862_cov_53_826265_g319_i0_p12_ORF_typecomplete_len100_score3_61_NODE_402_length_8862_cov_53_826265_g319_i020152314
MPIYLTPEKIKGEKVSQVDDTILGKSVKEHLDDPKIISPGSLCLLTHSKKLTQSGLFYSLELLAATRILQPGSHSQKSEEPLHQCRHSHRDAYKSISSG